MDQLICPLCNRDYELPRRYFIRPDDIDYLPVPRVLNCLHTCCQSCLEDIWQKNTLKEVTCPLCRHKQCIQGVRYMPLDGTALSQLIPLDGSSLSFCSRCHDEVPSFSWCGVCATTLCEFHHQDHKLSINTSRHEVLTFKDITRKNVRLEPLMPPISCPEELEQDATMYCHDCSCLLSAQAVLSNHVDHDCADARTLFDWAQNNARDNVSLCRERESGLVNAMKTVRNSMRELHSEREAAEKDLRTVFGAVREHLDAREKSLLRRLDEIANRKKVVLSGQLDEMSVALDNLRHAISVTETLLDSTGDVKGGPAYVLSSSKTISARCEEIDEDILNIPFEPQADPVIRATFVEREIKLLDTVLNSLGGLLTRDNIPEAEFTLRESQKKSTTDIRQQETPEISGAEEVADSKTTDEEDLSSKATVYAQEKVNGLSTQSWKINSNKGLFKLSFTVKTGQPPKLSVHNKMAASRESVVVEARIKYLDESPDCKACKLDEKNSGEYSFEDEKYVDIPETPDECATSSGTQLMQSVPSKHSVEEMLGDVVGQVVFLTEVDKRILKRHLVRSNYESFLTEEETLPTLRVTREIICN